MFYGFDGRFHRGSRCGSSFYFLPENSSSSSRFQTRVNRSGLVEIDLVGQCWTKITEGIAVFLGQGGLSKGSLLHRLSTFQLRTAAGCVLWLSVSRWQEKAERARRKNPEWGGCSASSFDREQSSSHQSSKKQTSASKFLSDCCNPSRPIWHSPDVYFSSSDSIHDAFRSLINCVSF